MERPLYSNAFSIAYKKDIQELTLNFSIEYPKTLNPTEMVCEDICSFVLPKSTAIQLSDIIKDAINSEQMMADFIEEKDRRGVKIFCTKSQWENHIIIESGHPIMKDNVSAVKETLRTPDYIYESHDSNPPFDYREVFSKKVENATYYKKIPYTKVVVSVVGGSGEVITAYPSKNPYGGTKGKLFIV